MSIVSEKTQDKSPPDKTPNPESPLVNAGQVAVTYTAFPPKGPPDKQIHPRRTLPEVPPKPPGGQDDK
jgi:hypothetical protein